MSDINEEQREAAVDETAEEYQAETAAETADQAKPAADDDEEDISLKSLFGDLMDIGEAIFVSMFVIILAFAYLFRPVTVDGSSMFPTLHDKDRLIMWSLGYTPTNGDIVIIDDDVSGHFADDAQTSVYQTQGLGMRLVKRVIAVGGQQINIDFENGTVAVDGVQLAEDYIADLTTRNDGAFTYPLTIPEGYVFVMGDNRLNSMDSRSPSVALIPEDEVIGKAVWRFHRDQKDCESWTDNYAVLF